MTQLSKSSIYTSHLNSYTYTALHTHITNILFLAINGYSFFLPFLSSFPCFRRYLIRCMVSIGFPCFFIHLIFYLFWGNYHFPHELYHSITIYSHQLPTLCARDRLTVRLNDLNWRNWGFGNEMVIWWVRNVN